MSTTTTSSATTPSADLAQRLEALAQRRRDAIRRTFVRLHPLALGCGVGVTLGLGVLAATLALFVRGGPKVGDNLKVLSSYFPGYSVDVSGALVGATYGFAAGFLLGYAVAAFRNLALHLVLGYARWSADRFRRRHMLDEI